MKKKWRIILSILIILFITWLSISIYYYFQQTNTVKEMKVSDDWEYRIDDNLVFKIMEIRLIEKNRAFPTSFTYNNSLLDKIALKSNNKILNDLSLFFRRVKYFYSSPYEENNGLWDMEVSGVYLEQDIYPFAVITAKGDTYKDTTIRVDGIRRQGDERSNIVLFSSMAEDINPNSNAFEIVFKLDEGDITFTAYPEDFNKITTYNYFKRVPSTFEFFTAEKTVLNVYRNYKDNQEINTLSFDATDKLEWIKEYDDINYHSVTNYLGKYKDYKDVFTVTIKIEKEQKEVGEQTYYLIEKDGQWEIVDIGPFELLLLNKTIN